MSIARKILTPALALLALAPTAIAQQGAKATVSGWVIDSACAFTKGLRKPISRECAVACAKSGSPLVIMRDDGAIFFPVSDQTPATEQNSKLLPYAGQHVIVTGKEYSHPGSHALVIETISVKK